MSDCKLIIVGASGHGKVVADIARQNGYTDIAFLDDAPDKTACAGYPVLGAVKDAPTHPDCDFIVAIGNDRIRQRVQVWLAEEGLSVVTLIHPAAVVAEDVVLGAGTVVAAGTVINPATVIGKGCIINTGATVDHDNVLADFVHVSVGSHLAGTVTVGTCTMIGAGAVVINNVSICENCTVGAGAVVISNIDQSGTYIGVPARKT